MPTPGAFSDYTELKSAKWLFQNTSPGSPPPTVYVALYTVAPTDAGGGTEVSATGTAYARQSVSTGASGTGVGSGWTTATDGTGTNSNTADIVFPVATAAWGTVTAVGILDAASGGNLLWWSNLETPIAILIAGVDQFRFPAGALQLVIN